MEEKNQQQVASKWQQCVCINTSTSSPGTERRRPVQRSTGNGKSGERPETSQQSRRHERATIAAAAMLALDSVVSHEVVQNAKAKPERKRVGRDTARGSVDTQPGSAALGRRGSRQSAAASTTTQSTSAGPSGAPIAGPSGVQMRRKKVPPVALSPEVDPSTTGSTGMTIATIEKGSTVRTQVKQVMGNLEDVLGELKTVVGEMRGLVSHIDTVTNKIDQHWPEQHRRLSAPDSAIPPGMQKPPLRQSMSSDGTLSRPNSMAYRGRADSRISSLWKHCKYIAVPEGRVRREDGQSSGAGTDMKYDFLLIPREQFLRYILQHTSKMGDVNCTSPGIEHSPRYENINCRSDDVTIESEQATTSGITEISDKIESLNGIDVIKHSECMEKESDTESITAKDRILEGAERHEVTSMGRECLSSQDLSEGSICSSLGYSVVGRKRKIGPSKASSIENSINEVDCDMWSSEDQCCCPLGNEAAASQPCDYCGIYERELNEKLEWEFLEDLPFQSDEELPWDSDGDAEDTEPDEVIRARVLSPASQHTQVNTWKRCTPDSLDLADSGVAGDEEYYSDTGSDSMPVDYNIRKNLMPRAAGGKLVNYSWRTVIQP